MLIKWPEWVLCTSYEHWAYFQQSLCEYYPPWGQRLPSCQPHEYGSAPLPTKQPTKLLD